MTETSSTGRDEVVVGLGSVQHLKLLRVLAKNPEGNYTKYQLEKETKLGPSPLRAALKRLVKISWIEEETIYKPSLYHLNLKHPPVAFLVEYFQNIGYV